VPRAPRNDGDHSGAKHEGLGRQSSQTISRVFESGRTIEALRADGASAPKGLRIIWSSPGYSHCCFTAHSDMDPALVEKITQTFVAIDAQDPAGKAVLEGEGCNGWRGGWASMQPD
jgi:ABC-type phosphate/phosphonate transport system substrate-binding protein